MNKGRHNFESIFLLFPFIVGMIFVRTVSEETLELLLQQLKQHGPVVTFVLFIIVLLYGIYRTIQGKEDYDANPLRLGLGLLISGAVGTIVNIIVLMII